MLSAAASRRLPGLAFEASTPPPRRVLPRMDIAAFVGFAAAGPLHVPVAVADAAEFEAVFGPDAPLALDNERSARVRAQLGPAVRAYFRNGGRRAWIVRVADAETAERSRMPVPGLLERPPGAQATRAAQLRARACGSWADGIAVGAALASAPAELRGVGGDPWTFELEVAGPPVVPGDLLRIRQAGDTLLVVVGGALPAEPPAPPGRRALTVACDPATALRLADGLMPAPAAVGSAVFAGGPDGVAATIPVGSPPDPPEPPVVEVDLALTAADAPIPGTLVRVDGVGPDPAATLWLRVEAVGEGDDGTVRVTGRAQWELGGDHTPAFAPGAAVERLTLELWARRGASERTVLAGLGLAPAHPRYLGTLPTDEALYALRDDAPEPDPELWAEAARPRFPLAGPTDDAPVYYPVATDVVPEAFLAPLHGGAPALVRDGLGELDPGLFVDPVLADTGAAALQAQADHVRWQAPRPRELRGLHALLHVDEATVVSVPDAVQRRWAPAPELPAPPAPPSDPVPDPPSRAGFAACALRTLTPAPVLELQPRDAGGSFGLSWNGGPAEADLRYVLEEGRDPESWDAAETLYAGPGRSIRLYGRITGTRFYRVRAEAGPNVSEWSNGVAVAATSGADFLVAEERTYDPGGLLAVQGALLRMCAARGDALAILSAPRHYRADAAIAHADRLRAGVDERTRSFGALYHPWLVLAEAERGQGAREVVPDGSVAGVVARRAATRGAWVAPANEHLADVVALVRPEPRERYGALLDAQVNEIRQGPGGFLCLAEDTLTRDADVRPINVRRLLSLLRRLALREGTAYVFEPNDPTFRRAIQRGFGEVLHTLYQLGALAGGRPEDAYRVDVGDPPNTPNSIDQGRVIVELRVAPSQPLAFLLIRLLRSGDRELEVEAP